MELVQGIVNPAGTNMRQPLIYEYNECGLSDKGKEQLEDHTIQTHATPDKFEVKVNLKLKKFEVEENLN